MAFDEPVIENLNVKKEIDISIYGLSEVDAKLLVTMLDRRNIAFTKTETTIYDKDDEDDDRGAREEV